LRRTGGGIDAPRGTTLPFRSSRRPPWAAKEVIVGDIAFPLRTIPIAVAAAAIKGTNALGTALF
jgi:hypothetical protein